MGKRYQNSDLDIWARYKIYRENAFGILGVPFCCSLKPVCFQQWARYYSGNNDEMLLHQFVTGRFGYYRDGSWQAWSVWGSKLYSWWLRPLLGLHHAPFQAHWHGHLAPPRGNLMDMWYQWKVWPCVLNRAPLCEHGYFIWCSSFGY